MFTCNPNNPVALALFVGCFSLSVHVIGCSSQFDEYNFEDPPPPPPLPPPPADPCAECSPGEICIDSRCEVAVALTAGAAHTCLRTESKKLYCWGRNDVGQLCVSTGTDAQKSPRFTSIGAIDNAIAGFDRSCIVDDTGSHRCCGGNPWGELGLGLKDNLEHPAAEPMKFANPDETVVLGGVHTCVRRVDGTLACVGLHDAGQLGAGPGAGSFSVLPISVAFIEDARLLSLGDGHGCAADTSSLWCWGKNGSGQVGDGTTTNRFAPVPIDLGTPSPVEVIAAGWSHTCAVDDGAVACWGGNAFGELGLDPAIVASNNVPSFVDGVDSVVDVIVGEHHTCARTQQRALWCWGSNASGQVAAGGKAYLQHPELVLGGVVQAVAGKAHTCALTEEGSVYCWGANEAGQLGTGDVVDRHYATVTLAVH